MYMANAYDGSNLASLDPNTRALIERRDAVLGSSYRLFYRDPVVPVRGSGVHLYDAEGREYLDVYNNVPAIGHSHPHVQRLVSEQLGVLNTHTRYLTEPVVAYSERLLALFPQELSKVVYTCTGSESVDLALRMARYRTGATGVICTRHAYHGTTAAAAEVSPSLGPNNLIGPNVVLVDAPDLLRDNRETAAADFASRVRLAVDELNARGVGVAAMIVDSILSSDGVQSHPTDVLREAVDVIHEAGGLWIADEVQPGFGRLGVQWWGFARHGIAPDMVVLGKPMGNGVPVAAVVGTEDAMDSFGRDIRYFNTFGGNPVSIAAATAVLDVIEEESLLDNARRVGEHLDTGLRNIAARHRALGDVRGCGLFVAAEFVTEDGLTPDPAIAAFVVDELRTRRILISASGRHANVLKIRPPMTFGLGDADRFLTELDDILGGAITSPGPQRS
ncbi:aspartate aminotransferase family protein [Rhodococcus sp. 06-412-2C]|uniref:aspartate aminotransferase family protein n=1 Tax=unclassified Rhodococcus (in: high G+C Gram-positive bacteria) TaxID=192944 RepID=UPI000B9BEAAE|nr:MULTISPECIES: aspartate aminotransferase family protein [unclassified Rhodococcus (in: high G+C Gram-positive bacteria)]OZC84933.1 aspartate aminotransferase family protein [Rhodococcus sp. 06-412-2C]OZC98674.1 aspartate aminotransferase family protein [Rhodococcus sp. 06-412-2B]